MSPTLFVVALVVVAGACSNGASSKGDAASTTRGCGMPAGGFTACVHACGETNAREDAAATCVDGSLQCPAGTTPAATCPTPWPGNSCGPWVEGTDCTTAAVCVDGLFWTCPGPDAGAG